MTFSLWSLALALRGASARVPFLSRGRGRGLANLALLSRYCTSRSRAAILASMSFESNTGFSVAGSLACSATVVFFQACGRGQDRLGASRCLSRMKHTLTNLWLFPSDLKSLPVTVSPRNRYTPRGSPQGSAKLPISGFHPISMD